MNPKEPYCTPQELKGTIRIPQDPEGTLRNPTVPHKNSKEP